MSSTHLVGQPPISNDDMDLFPANLLIDGIPAAAVVLSSEKIVIAANERMENLTRLPSESSKPGSLVGRSITSLNIVLVPTTRPVLRDWDSLFEAANSRLSPTSPRKRKYADSSIHSTELYKDSEADVETASFWEHEDRKELAMIDVLVYPRARVHEGESVESCKHIRARMCIRAIRWSSRVRYIITFRRPLIVRYVGTPIEPEIQEPEVMKQTTAGGAPSSQDISGEFPEASRLDVVQIINKLIPYCMAVLDQDGQALFFSASWYDFTGLSPDDSLGTGWANSVHPDDAINLTSSWAQCIRSGQGHWTHEARYRRKDGQYVYFLGRAQRTLDTEGTTHRWYASMLDVDQLVHARLKSDLRRQTIMALLSQADVSLWGVDQNREVYIREGTLAWDPSRSLGLESQCLDESRRECRDTSQGAQNDVGRILQTVLAGKPFQPSLEHQEGDRWYRTRFVADTGREGMLQDGMPAVSAALGITIDITGVKARAQLKIDNERLAASRQAAFEATHLKSQFLANMSHEIRTPIAGIIGLNELLRDTPLDQEQKQLCADISGSATFLLTLVNDILDFSKIEAGHMDIEAVPFSPLEVVEALHKLMSLQAKRKNLTLMLETRLLKGTIVVGDPGRLQQILTNLLSNAIKFTQSGCVTLTLESIPVGDRNGKLSSSAGDWGRDTPSTESDTDTINIQFKVEDTGCGIDDETMAKLFRPFTQADSSTARKHGGTGLGLTVSRDLVDIMGGKIQLTSEPSVGSTAIFNIPYKRFSGDTVQATASGSVPITQYETSSSLDACLVIEPGSVVKGDEAGTSEAIVIQRSMQFSVDQKPFQCISDNGRGSVNVLVVEDNAINQKIALTTLKRLGFPATAVWNGQEAIEYIAKSFTSTTAGPQPDVILMDCMMPVMDGYKATETIRRGWETDETTEVLKKIPIIAMTASTTKGDRERCEAAGMNDYLAKPVNRDDLRRMLIKWTTAKR